LFIAGGAFDGIERIISKRLNRQAVGYSSKNADNIDKDNLLQYIILKIIRFWIDSRDYWSFTSIDTHGSFR
jgi:ATP-dependent Clp protease ATP-binding subunit ClpX